MLFFYFRKTGRLEHQGIKIEFLGLIELYYDRGNHHEFLSLVSDKIVPAFHGTLCRPGAAASIDADEFELICHSHSQLK